MLGMFGMKWLTGAIKESMIMAYLFAKNVESLVIEMQENGRDHVRPE